MDRVALALVLALSAGACIPSFGEDPIDTTGPTPVAAAREGGSIRIGIDEPAGIDPGNVHEPAGALVVRTFCDTLIAFDPVTAEPKPALAQSWTITRGGRKLFLKLRPGVRFTDGTEFTAEAVVSSLSRVASEEYASASAGLLAPISGYAIVHGEADSDNPRLRRELAGVSAADKLTVEITLDEPRADFLRVLGHPATSPVSPAAVEADPAAFAQQPVCVGPYRVAQPYERGGPVVLERADDYHGGNLAYTNGGAGYVDRIVFVPGARRVDVWRAPLGASGPRVERATGGRVEFIGLPTSTEPFDDPVVREALSRALDRDALAAAAGDRVPARGILPPGLSERSAGCEAASPGRPDVPGARRLLASADVDLSGARASFVVNEGFGNPSLARAVARQWRDAFGLRLDIELVPFAALLERGRSQSGLGAVFRFGWEAAYPGPEPFLVPLFDDSGIGANNLSRFDSAGFADALEEARRTIDDDERADAYARVEDVVCREMPMIPVAVDVRAVHVRARVASAIERVLDAAGADVIVRELFVRIS